MIAGSAFGVRLWRLLSARRPSADTSIELMAARLARPARVAPAELGQVIEGAEPSPQIVELLAPALGIRTADMFVIAGLPVPVELAAAGADLAVGRTHRRTGGRGNDPAAAQSPARADSVAAGIAQDRAGCDR